MLGITGEQGVTNLGVFTITCCLVLWNFEDEEKFKLTDVMEFHFIEMPKLIKAWKDEKLDPWNDVLARWLLMLGMVDHRNNKVYDDIYYELEAIARRLLENGMEIQEVMELTKISKDRLFEIKDDM
ncbi:MAG TPA: PD-(D/E)XK nuclease family transposase [Virgibacillus sp.]|nr:PD-(D/E)XK nuclease family transposase [Virgibacillus sp.]HLR69793.1 PD-(D/E)XK nuclease family transposase [Virgibacillus sp.]